MKTHKFMIQFYEPEEKTFAYWKISRENPWGLLQEITDWAYDPEEASCMTRTAAKMVIEDLEGSHAPFSDYRILPHPCPTETDRLIIDGSREHRRLQREWEGHP